MSEQINLGSGAEGIVASIRSSLIKDLSERDYYEVLPTLDLVEKNWRLWRLDRSGQRFYYNPETDVFYPSVTSITWSMLPNSKFLDDWRLELAVKHSDPTAPDRYMNERSMYGTLMHIVYTQILIYGRIHSRSIKPIIEMYQELYNIEGIDIYSWVEEMKADVSAFMEWVYIYDVEPLAIEVPIYFPVYLHLDPERMDVKLHDDENKNEMVPYFVGWCSGTVDLVCQMNFHVRGSKLSKRTPANNIERITAVVDYKSGKKGFYESHKIQINEYFAGWNSIQLTHLNGRYPAQACFNFAPKNSTGEEATFHFKEQTDSEANQKFARLLEMFISDGKHEVGDIRIVDGEFQIGQSGSENVQILDPRDYINLKMNQENEE